MRKTSNLSVILVRVFIETEATGDICRSVSWRSRKASGIIQSENQERQGPRAGPSSSKFTLLLPFCSIQASTDWMLPACTGEGDLLYSCLLIPVLTSSGNSLIDTPRNTVLASIWASLSPVKLNIKLTITSP